MMGSTRAGFAAPDEDRKHGAYTLLSDDGLKTPTPAKHKEVVVPIQRESTFFDIRELLLEINAYKEHKRTRWCRKAALSLPAVAVLGAVAAGAASLTNPQARFDSAVNQYDQTLVPNTNSTCGDLIPIPEGDSSRGRLCGFPPEDMAQACVDLFKTVCNLDIKMTSYILTVMVLCFAGVFLAGLWNRKCQPRLEKQCRPNEADREVALNQTRVSIAHKISEIPELNTFFNDQPEFKRYTERTHSSVISYLNSMSTEQFEIFLKLIAQQFSLRDRRLVISNLFAELSAKMPNPSGYQEIGRGNAIGKIIYQYAGLIPLFKPLSFTFVGTSIRPASAAAAKARR